MAIACHSGTKYLTGTRLSIDHDSPLMRVETWCHGPGRLPDVEPSATEVAVMFAGRLEVERAGDGRHQRSFATPGTFWLCPAGIRETDIFLSDVMQKTVHIFLPPDLLGLTALEEMGLDPGCIQLDYAGGTFDPLISQIAATFRARSRDANSTVDKLFFDSMRVALATHLIRNYNVRQQRSADLPHGDGSLDVRRLRRVLDLIEARLADDLTLQDLANAACLSPFHFARSFRNTMGKTPHQFLVERRIVRAKQMLANRVANMADIAADTGFKTQSGFTKSFRKITGETPGRFRDNFDCRSGRICAEPTPALEESVELTVSQRRGCRV